MTLDNDKLHTAILVKLNNEEMSRHALTKKLEFSPEVIIGIRKGTDIKFGNLLKIVKWLDKNINDYIKT